MFGKREGGAIVAVLMIIVLLNLTMALVYYTVNSSIKRSGERRAEISALNSAEAAKERLFAMVRSDQFTPVPQMRKSAFSDEPFGLGTHSASCSTSVSGDTLYVNASCNENGYRKNLVVVGVLAPPMQLPVPNIRGAITARSHIDLNGTIDVDGRDYDSIIGGGIVGTGVYGVSTCSTLTVDGSSAVGGNGVPLEKKDEFEIIRAKVSEENVMPSGIFDSPEAFLGVSPGKLDSYKVEKLPSPPFHGIYYLTKDAGPIDFGEFSSGILIVSNPSRTAELKANGGTFKGLIIVDKMDKLNGNAEVLGAVVSLYNGTPTKFGNGTAQIQYSSRVLNNLGRYCPNMKKNIKEISWREIF